MANYLNMSTKMVSGMALCCSIFATTASAQDVQSHWELGGGFAYPLFYESNVNSEYTNYGVYGTLQNNPSEHIGIRSKIAYAHLEGEWNGINPKVDLISTDLSLLYYFVPCEPVTPYVFAGFGGNYKILSDRISFIDRQSFGAQIQMGTGASIHLNPILSFNTEIGYTLTNNSELDGRVVPTEMNGRDSYFSASAGISINFGKGAPSVMCNFCKVAILNRAPARDLTDYSRIEDLIIRHIPQVVENTFTTEVIREFSADSSIVPLSHDRLVIIGVNFASGQSDLLPESFPVLDKGYALLQSRPEVRIEIEGYTDDVGNLEDNVLLSKQRAERVKEYLVIKGIEEKRIATFGYGKRNPIDDNLTANGREMNRRIVFRIIK